MLLKQLLLCHSRKCLAMKICNCYEIAVKLCMKRETGIMVLKNHFIINPYLWSLVWVSVNISKVFSQPLTPTAYSSFHANSKDLFPTLPQQWWFYRPWAHIFFLYRGCPNQRLAPCSRHNGLILPVKPILFELSREKWLQFGLALHCCKPALSVFHEPVQAMKSKTKWVKVLTCRGLSP